MSDQDTKPWVIVSNVKENTTPQDLARISPLVSALVDDWQSKGKIMWSGAFDNEASSMAVFEATEQEAKEFFQKYGDVCSGVLEYKTYQWDAMPILSIISK
ncbi:MAG: hypothetical protein K5793_08835 [Nitrosarchaeum sp.]|nr:hypothetical protein [Nitrosarchaeum sp.]MCV0398398.1 hypothetical protein [Nitrosarchaeum sp.]